MSRSTRDPPEPVGSGDRNLGRISKKPVKRHLPTDNDSEDNSNLQAKKLKLCSNDSKKITVYDSIYPNGAPDRYWQIIEDKRQVAFENFLKELEMLKLKVERQKICFEMHKQMLEKAKSLMEVQKVKVLNHNNDSGIDVIYVSAADETEDESDEIQYNTDDSVTS